MVIFGLFGKLKYSNEKSTKFESLQRIEVFGGGKWQNITQKRKFVWVR